MALRYLVAGFLFFYTTLGFTGTSVIGPFTYFNGGAPFSTVPAETLIHYPPGGNQIIGPSAGETVTAGQPYTIKWNTIAANKVNINLYDDEGNSRDYGDLCDGYWSNPYCGKLIPDLPNTGEYVWKVTKLTYFDNTAYMRGPYWIRISVPTDSNLDPDQYPYYSDSKSFMILQPGSGHTSTTKSPSPAARPTSTPSETAVYTSMSALVPTSFKSATTAPATSSTPLSTIPNAGAEGNGKGCSRNAYLGLVAAVAGVMVLW